MKIKFIKPRHIKGQEIAAGSVLDVSDNTAKVEIDLGFAVEETEPRTEVKTEVKTETKIEIKKKKGK